MQLPGSRLTLFLVGILVMMLMVSSGCLPAPQAGVRSEEQNQASESEGERPQVAPTSLPVPGSPASQDPGQKELTTAIQDAARVVRPAVVFISVRAVAVDEFLQPVPRVGVGSGVIYDPSGLILTNNHVVGEAQRVRVALVDGRTFEATVVGRDPLTDLAVLKIEGDNLPVVPLGNSADLEVGEWVVAIGNALGLEGGPTVTEGIVSATDRSIEAENGVALENLIQTSAAINPGNSGGPLVNLEGEVIGINTAVPGPTARGLQPTGIGFAIAIDAAKPIISDLVQQGRVVRPFLGVDTFTVTPALAVQLGLSVPRGALIIGVGRGTPAARAGLAPGDVIVSFGGQDVGSARDLRREIMARQIGEEVALVAVRDGTRRELSVTLQERPSAP